RRPGARGHGVGYSGIPDLSRSSDNNRENDCAIGTRFASGKSALRSRPGSVLPRARPASPAGPAHAEPGRPARRLSPPDRRAASRQKPLLYHTRPGTLSSPPPAPPPHWRVASFSGGVGRRLLTTDGGASYIIAANPSGLPSSAPEVGMHFQFEVSPATLPT